MSFLRRTFQSLLLGATLVSSAFAANTPQVNVSPKVRITAKVDVKATVKLQGTVSGRLATARDLGRASGAAQLKGMQLVLKSSDEQEAVLQNLMDAQQDKNSPNYHKWATPETFAAQFGVASPDIKTVTDWLGTAGITVNAVSGGRIITFTGSVSAIESAFRTEIHSVVVDGETHLANTTEVSIPAALASVVLGPSKLNDIPVSRKAEFKKIVMGKDGQMYPVIPGTNNPDYTSLSSGSHYITPADFATIYNTKGLLAAGTNGTGIKIGVVGRSLVNLADAQVFRSIFGLPNQDPTILNGGDTAIVNGDDVEADLDVQWAGAVGTLATVIYAPQGLQIYSGGDITGSALAYINQNNVDIITMSYGGCEASDGPTQTALWNSMWEQAAAQGQSVFVSSGDSSATGCVGSGSTTAGPTAAYGVNALGSSAYNVAVGGTMFNEGSYVEGLKKGVTMYWGPGGISPYGTALSYIPEAVMSDGAFNQVLGGAVAESQGNPGVFGGGGGVSQYTARPAWQVGVGITSADPAGPTFTASGAIPAGTPHRLVPDISLIGSLSHDDAIVCYDGSCSVDPNTGLINGIGAVGGTSVATPVMASVMALIDQKNGGRQGNPNFHLYKLAAAEASIAACASQAPPASTCNFNDIVVGDNFSPKTTNGLYVPPVLDPTGTTIVTPGYIQGTLGTDYIGFPATVGYDEATGLGSPVVANLVNNWSTVSYNSTVTTLTLTPTTANHGTTMTAAVTVTSPSGTPTGDVAIVANTVNGQANTITLSAGTGTKAIVDLPGGTYNVVARYAGDGTYSGSTSAPVAVTIAKEASTTYVEPDALSSTGGLTQNVGTYPYGYPVFLSVEIVGNSATSFNPTNNAPNTGIPTGTATYTLSNGGAALPTFTQTLDGSGLSYLLAGGTFPSYYIAQNYQLLPAGTYSASVVYSGDNSFNTSTGTASFVIAKATSTPTITTKTADITSGATAIFVVVSPPATGGRPAAQTGAYPTGLVTLTDTSNGNAVIGSGQLLNGTAVITSNLLTIAGAHAIKATTAGDGNYNTGTSSTVTVTVTTGTAPTISVTATPTPIVLQTVTLTATVPTGATGSVAFFDNGIYLGQGTINTTTLMATYSTGTLTAGTHPITATYSGNATVTSATSSVYSLVIAKNSPTLRMNAASNTNTGNVTNLQARFTPAPASAASANPFPSGVVNFYDGTNVVGTAPIVYSPSGTYLATASVTLPVGPHSISAVYPGDANYFPTPAVTPEVINLGATTTTVTSSVTSIGVGLPFTLTAKVAPVAATTTGFTGMVTFKDNGVVLQTVQISSAGVATSSTIVLTTAGSHTITATYLGDQNFQPSTGTLATAISVVTPGLSITPGTIYIVRGQSGLLNVTATGLNAYNGSFALSCTGLPAYTTCVFGSAIAPNSAAPTQTIAMSIVTAPLVPVGSGGFFWIPALLLAGFLGLRRKQLGRGLKQTLALVMILCGAMSISGCGKSIDHLGSNAGSPLGTYNVTVSAVGTGTAPTPNLTVTGNVTVNIVAQ